MDRRLHRVGDVLIVSGTALAILIALTGGAGFAIAGFRLSVRSLPRPLAVAAIGLAIRIWLGVRERRSQVVPGDGAAFHAGVQLAFATILAVVLGLAVAWQVRACGGLDSYGYVSAASLLASGTLKQTEPLTAILPFESGIRALTPLGYVVTPDGGAIVPRFPLGFPMAMTPFLILGRDAVFFVPLLCGIVTVCVAYVFARERSSWIGAALAATLVATDPVFVNQAIQPMSDVPAAMWMLVASWLALRESPRPLLSGAAAGMAFLTRPVLLVAAAVIGASMLLCSRRAFVQWVVVMGLFVVAQGVIQYSLFGNAFGSGYGSAEHLFQLSRLPANVANYARWLTFVYGATIVATGGAFVVLGRFRWVWIAAAIAAGVAAPYLLYVRFDDWEVTRFLLPGSTLMLVVTACGLATLLRSRLSVGGASAVALLIALAVSARSYAFLTSHGVPKLAQQESKYPLLGEWFLMHTPPDAIVVSSLHSGSIRYYSGRKTVRWDEIPAGKLLPTVTALDAAHRVCYLALDGPEEEQLFRARFAGEIDAVTFMPAARLRGLNIVTLEPRR